MKIDIDNIEWDLNELDGEVENNLPKTIWNAEIREVTEDTTEYEVFDIVEDWLSDEYGWCVKGFTCRPSDGGKFKTVKTAFDAHYYLLVDEWNYPTESGREPHSETFDTLDGALRFAKNTAEAEEPTFEDCTGLDCLCAEECAPSNGDCGSVMVTCKNGLDPWYFATRVIKVNVLPN